jgi:hypothetical protein
VIYKYYNTTLDFADPKTSPCGEDTVLNFSTELRVSNAGNKDGYGAIGVGEWTPVKEVSLPLKHPLMSDNSMLTYP